MKTILSVASDSHLRITGRRFQRNSFFSHVYQVVRQIPPGKILTYGQIATLLGAPYMARQVGWAMHGCPPGLPWHRVIGAGGRILINSFSTAEGPVLQRKLLEMEGVRFLGKYVDMKAHQYIPPKKTRKKKSLRHALGPNLQSSR